MGLKLSTKDKLYVTGPGEGRRCAGGERRWAGGERRRWGDGEEGGGVMERKEVGGWRGEEVG